MQQRHERDAVHIGLITVRFITLLFASNSPALHSAFELTSNTSPVLLINAVVSIVGFWEW